MLFGEKSNGGSGLNLFGNLPSGNALHQNPLAHSKTMAPAGFPNTGPQTSSLFPPQQQQPGTSLFQNFGQAPANAPLMQQNIMQQPLVQKQQTMQPKQLGTLNMGQSPLNMGLSLMGSQPMGTSQLGSQQMSFAQIGSQQTGSQLFGPQQMGTQQKQVVVSSKKDSVMLTQARESGYDGFLEELKAKEQPADGEYVEYAITRQLKQAERAGEDFNSALDKLQAFENALYSQCMQLQRDLEHSEIMKAITDENSLELTKAESEQQLIDKQLSACEQALQEVLDRRFGQMNKSQQDLRNAIFGMPPTGPVSKEEKKKDADQKFEFKTKVKGDFTKLQKEQARVDQDVRNLSKQLDSEMDKLSGQLAAVELGGAGVKEILMDRTIIGEAMVKMVVDSERVKKQVQDCGNN
ncbi:hypothetical protein FGO68_gene13641 [Halteria grandinella]|uniref:Uncharacterized protein n=1 Tax=Halteria grandinella TaxID=5974 RepID=A0A8J8T822_HALGN|nr:hypothetical protein FGO68_gene13641 [Halteria grandinella]